VTKGLEVHNLNINESNCHLHIAIASWSKFFDILGKKLLDESLFFIDHKIVFLLVVG
jgi:hypothetical protein